MLNVLNLTPLRLVHSPWSGFKPDAELHPRLRPRRLELP